MFLGYYTFYRPLTSRSNLDINLLLCFWLQYYLLQYIKAEERTICVCFLFFFIYLFFITLINSGTQIRGSQTRYTVDSFGLNQPLSNKGPLDV